MRALYSILLYLLLPLLLLRLIWLGLRRPGYRDRWIHRFGFVPRLSAESPRIWIHAVSVGEVRAAQPLIRALRRQRPDLDILVTTTTPTGADCARRQLGNQAQHCYAPYDLPDMVDRFLERTRPRLLVLMETELWPNLLAACRRRGIPTLLANGRLSERSRARYARAAGLVRGMLDGLDLIAARSGADAERFLSLGASQAALRVAGNLKFDLQLPADLPARGEAQRRTLGTGRPIWIAASTHEGEEAHVLEAAARIRASRPETLLILVPRHPERGARVAALCRRRGQPVVSRSENRYCSDQTVVYLVDSVGELPLFLAASDVAFMGGSLVPVGGHNMLEPAALGVPVLTGPQVFNFSEVNDLLEREGALMSVTDSDELAAAVLELLGDPGRRRAMGEAGRRVVEANRGAAECVAGMALNLLDGQCWSNGHALAAPEPRRG